MVANSICSQQGTCRILLVEDNYLVAMNLKSRLEALGCSVVGPAAELGEAVKLARQQELDGAILDINIIGGDSSPVAMELLQRQCPFFFVTGYASPQMQVPGLAQHPRLRKPIDDQALRRALDQHIQGAVEGTGGEGAGV